MTHRYRSLDDALIEVDGGGIAAGSSIVVSWWWWDALSELERGAYRARCDERGVRLSTDHRISRHFVEASDSGEPPLSSERSV